MFIKLGKNNYIQSKSYLSIAFFNIISKRFEKIVVMKINYLIKNINSFLGNIYKWTKILINRKRNLYNIKRSL